MKFFVCLTIFAVVFAVVAAKPSVSKSVPQAESADVEAVQAEAESDIAADSQRFRKAAYGGAHAAPAPSYVASPPCPTNYLFSCSPNLAPVPCAHGSGASYAPHGAYSAPVPAYLPQGFEGAIYQF